MNIAIDLGGLLAPPIRNRGIGNYVFDQLKELFQQDVHNNYYLLNLFEDIDLKQLLEYGDNVKSFYFYTGENNELYYNKSYKDVMNNIYFNFIRENNIDLFWLTYTFNPLFEYDSKVFKETKVIVTVYDIIPYIFQKEYLMDKNVRKWFIKCIEFIEQSDYLFAISESVKRDLIEYLQIEECVISNISTGVSDKFKKIPILENDKMKLYTQYGIKDEYIMCTGGEDFRKNIDGLIIAYSKLPKELINKFQLVIVCKMSPHIMEAHQTLAISKNVGHRVIFTNFVTEEELILLYNGAKIMAFPSKYEGFGLPVIEAMKCGTPVLTSQNSSLGEIAEGAAFLVDPFDITVIESKLEEALNSDDLAKYVDLGFARASQYTWKRTAELTKQVFCKIESEEKQTIKLTRDSIAIFLPGTTKNVLFDEYVSYIIKESNKKNNIQIFTDNLGCTEYIDEKRIKNCSEFYPANFDKIIYIIANHKECAFMLPYIYYYRGFIDTHDLYLPIPYLQIIKEAKDELELDELKNRFFKEYISSSYNKTPPYLFGKNFVTEYSDVIIVHNNLNKKEILQQSIHKTIVNILEGISDSSCIIEDSSIRLVNLVNEEFNIVGNDVIEKIINFLGNNTSVRYEELLNLSKTVAYAKRYCFKN